MGGSSLSAVPGRCAALIGALAVTAAVAMAGAGLAQAARLVGGREQTAIDRAFFADGAHRGQAIVSTRVSTIEPAWSVVKTVVPLTRATSPTAISVPRLRATYYHRVGGVERRGRPPGPALADLRHRFTVDVQYSGSGSETIVYDQLGKGVCAGLGGFTDDQQETVRPMSWVVRYAIDPDDLLSATRGPSGTVLVPRVSFLRSGSSLHAVQRLQRSVVDLSCAGRTTRWACTETDQLAPSTDLLAFPPGEGLEIGVPITSRSTGQCAAADYSLGPSLWDSGATTALVGTLGIDGGGRLASDPYKPISVAWPGGSAQQQMGFVTSPCQGDPSCTDAFGWRGVVALVPADGG